MSLMAMSISGAVLILVILAVRAGLKGWLPKRTFAVLWTVALIRLLVPFSVPSSWSAYTLIQNAVPETEQVRYFTDMIAGNPSGEAVRFGSAASSRLYGTDTAGDVGDLPGWEDGFGDGTGMQSGPGSGTQKDPGRNPQSKSGAGSGAQMNSAQNPQSKSGEESQPDSASGIQSGRQQVSSIASDFVSEEMLSFAEHFAALHPMLRGIWAAGFLLCAVAFAWIYFRCCREFQMSLPIEDCFLENWQRTHPLRRRLSIRQSDQILSPLSYGVWRPVILLPKSTKCGDRFQLRYVLEHEYVHIRYFDAAVKLLMAAALCIHWFNPCVYLMYIFFNRDLELACDEAVVRRFGEEEKSAYAMALIEMEEEKSGLLPLANSFSKNAIEERIGAIMKIKKISPLVHGLSAALVCGTTLLFATSCGSYEEAEKTMEAVPRAEAVDAEEAKTNNSVETKSLSVALKELGQYGPSAEQSMLLPSSIGTAEAHTAGDQEETAANTAEKAAKAAAEDVEKAIAQVEAEAEALRQAEKAAEKAIEQIAEVTEQTSKAAEGSGRAEKAAYADENGKHTAQAEEISAGSDTEYTTDNPYHSVAYMISIGEEFEEYEKFGLSYDKKSDFLMYKNQTVGFFKDETKPGVYTRLVEGSGDLGITVNREKSGKITDFSVFPFNENSLTDSSVSEDAAVKEGSGIIRWDDSGDIVSIVSFPAEERGNLEAYAAEQGDADEAKAVPGGTGSTDSGSKTEAVSGTAVSSEGGLKTQAASGGSAYSEGDPNTEKTSLPKEYEKLGVKTSDEKNNEWTYKGKGVAVIYDKDHWIYTNDTIPEKKAVYLEVVRDKKDRVTELREITKKEMQKLFDEE